MTISRFKTSPALAVVSLAIATVVAPLPASAADAISDANIGAIVVTANQIDIDYGKNALAKSKSKEIRNFAQRMITDHSAVQNSVLELAAKLKLIPEENATSQSLKDTAVNITARQNMLKGRAFDKFYIDNEVNYHKQVTDALETMLIPNAKNAELKAALVGAQALFLKHLEHCRQIQANWGTAHDSHP
jgi:putative membrane protein